ncbi:DUF3917 domain-containing protein [Bacillus sp. HC-Mk]
MGITLFAGSIMVLMVAGITSSKQFLTS